MKKKKIAISKKTIIDMIKAKDRGQLQNYTFRLPEALIADFKRECERNDVSMASALLELIKVFVSKK